MLVYDLAELILLTNLNKEVTLMDQRTGLKECPKCGGTEFGKGKQSGYATLNHPNKIFSIGS